MEKLIRDNIIEIIKSKWEKCNYYIADNITYTKKLYEKLIEESNEVINSKNKDELTEEIADLLEVINTICFDNDIDKNKLEEVKKKKKFEKWWFSKKIILKTEE